ncbi:MAG: hypothetical protein D6780_04975 [Candidatus Dadabacteria bacterium]|nr:MAG: hypothetical protein D6780_04975 [Candidatus Dadabacteria bacterium]
MNNYIGGTPVNHKNHLPQFDPAHLPGRSWDPISELMRAMILRAVEDYQSGKELRKDALEYFYSEEEDYILSFRYICKHFGLDPDKTREKILKATKRISTRRRAA